MPTTLAEYGVFIGAFGGAGTFLWSAFQWLSIQAKEARSREFEVYHRLIKELVEPKDREAPMYIDRQMAIIYELRFFPRYFPITNRILLGLKSSWSTHEENFVRLLTEIDLTVSYIKELSGV